MALPGLLELHGIVSSRGVALHYYGHSSNMPFSYQITFD